MINNKLALKWRKLFEKNISIRTLAQQFNVADGTIRRAIIRAGGTLPKSTGRKYTDSAVLQWAKLYQEGTSITLIASKFNASPAIVQNRLMTDYGIQMRRERTFTEGHKKNIGTSLKGRISPNKNVSMTEEQKIKISESVKSTMRTPEMREYISKTMKGKLVGDKHPAWQGGISQKYKKGYKNKYPSEFNKQLKRQIMVRDNNTCQHCGTQKDLTVHHIDYIKNNCTEENLLTACRSCNSKFNINRTQWATHWQNFQIVRGVSKFA